MGLATTEHVVETIHAGGIVAIIRLPDLSRSVELTRALLAGGIRALEFTLTNPAAIDALIQVRRELEPFRSGEAVLGIGSVRSLEQARAATAAGAQFIVSPITQADVIAHCRQAGVVAVPGALTPTEIVTAQTLGAEIIKVFPARAFGPRYIKDLREPLPDLRLLPTGGIDQHNAGEYLRAGAFAIGAGGGLVDRRSIERGDWQALTAAADALVSAVNQARKAG